MFVAEYESGRSLRADERSKRARTGLSPFGPSRSHQSLQIGIHRQGLARDRLAARIEGKPWAVDLRGSEGCADLGDTGEMQMEWVYGRYAGLSCRPTVFVDLNQERLECVDKDSSDADAQ